VKVISKAVQAYCNLKKKIKAGTNLEKVTM